MFKTYLSFALTLLLTCTVSAAPLTVVVAVDGLDATALSEMQPYWQQGGLRTLSEEAYQTCVEFDHWLYGGEESLATLLTGCNPDQHGLCSNYAFSRTSRQPYAVLEDKQVQGIGCSKGYSAQALLAPTATDRLRIAMPNQSRIYAIGIDPTPTILLGGHAANAVCWLGQPRPSEPVRWCSTSYYQEGLPAIADQMNVDGSLTAILNHTWTPRMTVSAYLHPTADEQKHGFSYQIPQASYRQHPAANAAVIQLALNMQKELGLGTGTQSDVMLLQLTVCTPAATQSALGTAEQEDMYMCLNQDLGFLMEQLTRRIGAERLRVVVLGVPRLGQSAEVLDQWNMTQQSFSLDKAVALTSTYLMALYGHERWLDGGFGHCVYLNRTLIEQKHLSLATMREQVADFLMEFDGVSFACVSSQARLYDQIASSLHKRFMGDVVFTLQPNYTLSESSLPAAPVNQSPVLIWSGSRTPFPPALHDATEVAGHLL